MVDVPGVGPAAFTPPGIRGVDYSEDDEPENDERAQIERYAEMFTKMCGDSPKSGVGGLAWDLGLVAHNSF